MAKSLPFRIKPLRPWHCWAVTRQFNVPAVRDVLKTGRLRLAATYTLYSVLGPAAALFCGRRLLAIGGLLDQAPGVAEAWSVHTAALGELDVGFRFCRLARRQLDRWIKEGRYHRVSATCSVWADLPTRYRFVGFLLALGFEVETTLEKADALQQDVLVFKRLRKEAG